MLIEIWDIFFCLMLYLGIFDSERGKTFQPRCQGFPPRERGLNLVRRRRAYTLPRYCK